MICIQRALQVIWFGPLQHPTHPWVKFFFFLHHMMCYSQFFFRLYDLNFPSNWVHLSFFLLFRWEICVCMYLIVLNVSGWPAVQNGPSLSEIRRKQGIQEKRLCFCSKFLFHGIFYTFLIYHTPNLSLPELFFLICCCGLSTYNWVTCTILIVSEGYKQ